MPRSSSSRTTSADAQECSTRSGQARPRQSESASRSTFAARSTAPRRRKCAASVRASSKRLASSDSESSNKTYPAPVVSTEPGGSARRRCEMYVCRILGADDGSVSPHSPTSNDSAGTVRSARSASISSTARSLGAPMATRPWSERTWSGPSNATCTASRLRPNDSSWPPTKPQPKPSTRRGG